MRKQYFTFTLVAVVMAMLAAGCQKEKLTGTVTLGAVLHESVSGDSKVYIDGYTPCWHNGDMVFINDDVYPVAAAYGSSARIENVSANSQYRAVFPASIVVLDPPTSFTNLVMSDGIPVFLPSHQIYRKIGGHQRVQVPMGAHLSSSEGTLEFHNLCSVVRVTVSNDINNNNDITLHSISLRANDNCLSGNGVATINASGSTTENYAIRINEDVVYGSGPMHSVTLDCPGEVIPCGQSADFDIVVPKFVHSGTDDIAITVALQSLNGLFTHKTIKHNVTLPNNTITTTTVTDRQNECVFPDAAAYLVSGNDFKDAIYNATQQGDQISVKFEYNSTRNPATVSNCVILSAASSNIPIYGFRDGDVWRVFTAAPEIYANESCNQMFRVSDYDGSNTIGRIVSIDFGDGFNTSQVTNMSNMFCECTELKVLDVSSFNTENVTNMDAMFSVCKSLRTLDLSNFNTSQVINMSHMFSHDENLRYIDLSSFNTARVWSMVSMFYGCKSMTKLDLSSFSTSGLDNRPGYGLGGMFGDCWNMTELNIHDFDVSGGADIDNIFSWMAANSGRCKITCKSSMRTALEGSNQIPTGVGAPVFTWDCWDE